VKHIDGNMATNQADSLNLSDTSGQGTEFNFKTASLIVATATWFNMTTRLFCLYRQLQTM
jgi:hypothetical protein